jgi:hypothetical protein
MEMLLRRIGSFVYEKRTRDRVGAINMLAMAAPGTGADIAPAWLVGESTAYSREEFSRGLRSHSGRGSGAPDDGGRGRGKGRGRSQDGANTADGGAAPKPDGDAPGRGRGGKGRDGPVGRGRGRGRH